MLDLGGTGTESATSTMARASQAVVGAPALRRIGVPRSWAVRADSPRLAAWEQVVEEGSSKNLNSSVASVDGRVTYMRKK